MPHFLCALFTVKLLYSFHSRYQKSFRCPYEPYEPLPTKTTVLTANMLQSLKGSSKLRATMGRIKYQRKTGKEKRLITKQEMWKRTTIAHSARRCSKEENLFYPPKKTTSGNLPHSSTWKWG